MVDSRDKGARAELVVRDALREKTGLKWERVPGSGALDEKHGLKGDLYIPGKENLYCVEVKHYSEDHFNSKLLSGKNPQLLEWWSQAVRQGEQVSKTPILIFKHDRSKLFVAFEDYPDDMSLNFITVNIPPHSFNISLLDDWLSLEKPKFHK